MTSCCLEWNSSGSKFTQRPTVINSRPRTNFNIFLVLIKNSVYIAAIQWEGSSPNSVSDRSDVQVSAWLIERPGVHLRLDRLPVLFINYNRGLAVEKAVPRETEAGATVTLKRSYFSRNQIIVSHIWAQMSRLNTHTRFSIFILFLSIDNGTISQDSGIRTSVLLLSSFVLWAMLSKFHESQNP